MRGLIRTADGYPQNVILEWRGSGGRLRLEG
jgi:hypothetical protein